MDRLDPNTGPTERPTEMVTNAPSEAPNESVATGVVPTEQPSLRRSQRQKIALSWLLVVLWATVIWQLGTDAYSMQRTSDFFQPLFQWLFGDLDLATRYKIHLTLRKTAHFSEYAILALLSFRAALMTAASTRLWTAGFVALFFVATLAAADEFRQAYSTARTGSPYDVLIDLAGGLVGVLGVLVITRRMRAAAPLRSTA